MATAPKFETDVSSDYPFTIHRADVIGSQMSYIDTQPNPSPGSPTALFIHGNLSSSYLWRNIIPHVSPLTRCVAPDLIGMGNSSKLGAAFPYRFTDHYTFLSTFINTVVPTGPIVLVLHDWGSALGLHWAHQQAESSLTGEKSRVTSIVLMEFLRPMQTWKEFEMPPEVEQAFRAFRTPKMGRKLIIEDNILPEKMLPGGSFRKLSDTELEIYKRPWLEPSSREPLYVWPNQIPIEQQPPDVWDIATRFHEWLLKSDVPKLLFYATPGNLVSPEKANWYLETMTNVTGVDLGDGLHFPQEDHPHAIGKGIHDWVKQLL